MEFLWLVAKTSVALAIRRDTLRVEIKVLDIDKTIT